MPRLLVACDFQNFYWKNLEDRSEGRFKLEDLPKHLEMFWWLAGYQRVEIDHDEEAANLIATAYMAKLHDAVLASGYPVHALREWLTRILFCLFADDTQVWDRNAFTNYVYLHTREDGSDLGGALAFLFQILNTDDSDRPNTLDEDLVAFTYINGDLFAEVIPIPSCDRDIRNALLAACKFDWSAISPAIFGSMFQNVMTPAERRELGAHYTTEENILKTIRPLFLDELENDLARSNSKAALDRFHDKIAGLTFLDPACGCGNFLVIAYRELRRLENELWAKRAAATKVTGMTVFDVSQICRVKVDQFYGIEIEEFPARIARTALYLMDHKANLEFSALFGQYFVRFPIPASPHIRVGNALRFDWNDLLPAERANFVFGNPPFVGRQHRSTEQTDDQQLALGADFNGYLDYVSSWFSVAARYLDGHSGRFAFVATNSICQGEQVDPLWSPLLSRGYTIDFAYRTFPWTSEARGTAAVHVVIIGMSQSSPSSKRLFSFSRGVTIEDRVSNINPYLAPAPSLIVRPSRSPLQSGRPRAAKGSKPTDGGHLLVEIEDAAEVRSDAIASKFLYPAIGARGMLHNESRYCLRLTSATPTEIRSSRVLRARLQAVQDFRSASRNARTRMLASRPSEFDVDAQPDQSYLCVPCHSSENRRTIPMAFFGAETIVLDSAISIAGATDWLFALLQSSMFTEWVGAIGGRLKSDFRIAPDLVYNTFPFPDLSDGSKTNLSAAANEVLRVRASFPTSTLADLYDLVAMPPALVTAHDSLDALVDSLYSPRKRLVTDSDRLSVLFARYEALTSPLIRTASSKRKR